MSDIYEEFIETPITVDDVGKVFIGKTKVLRAINNKYISHIKELFDSGLLYELQEKELFPKTYVSNQKIDGFELVIEHEKIDVVTYPYEWSPEMLRSAGNCILDVNEIANKYGYELKDAHPFNIIFKYNKPMFVDLGSFIKRRSKNGFLAYQEFHDYFIETLRLVENGFFSIFKHIFNYSNINSDELTRINNISSNIATKILPSELLKKIKKIFKIYIASQCYDEFLINEKINEKLKNGLLRKLASFMLTSDFLPLKIKSVDQVRKELNNIKLNINTEWGNYSEESGYYDKNMNIVLSERLKWVVEKISNLGVNTVIELAGNQGVLSRYISRLPNIKHVICNDYDPVAIDKGFLNLRNDEKVYMVNFDFMGDIRELLSPERAIRMKSDLVVALAVTHHLVLSQKYSLDSIFNILKRYTNRYIIIEFMPLGLWDGKNSPVVPEWYTVEWFENAMKRHFDIINKAQLEKNRICYVGCKI